MSAWSTEALHLTQNDAVSEMWYHFGNNKDRLGDRQRRGAAKPSVQPLGDES